MAILYEFPTAASTEHEKVYPLNRSRKLHNFYVFLKNSNSFFKFTGSQYHLKMYRLLNNAALKITFVSSFLFFLNKTYLVLKMRKRNFSNKLIWDSKICKLFQVDFVSLPIVTAESEFVCQFHFPSAQAKKKHSVGRYKSESKSFHEIAIVRHFPAIAVMEKVFCLLCRNISVIGWWEHSLRLAIACAS